MNTPALNPVEYVRQHNGDLADAFQAMRRAATQGPLDETTSELILLAALATTGEEQSFRLHARRLVKLGAPPDAMRQAVMITMAATTTWSQVVAALKWVDAVLEEAS